MQDCILLNNQKQIRRKLSNPFEIFYSNFKIEVTDQLIHSNPNRITIKVINKLIRNIGKI